MELRWNKKIVVPEDYSDSFQYLNPVLQYRVDNQSPWIDVPNVETYVYESDISNQSDY